MTELREAVAEAICEVNNGHRYSADAYHIDATAALTALSQSGPTEAMVEAGARAALHEAGADPDVFVGINGQAAYETVKGQVRACLTAAFKELGEK